MPETQTFYQLITTPAWDAPSVVFNASLGPPTLPWADDKRYAVLLDSTLAASWHPATVYVALSSTESTFIRVSVCDESHYITVGEGGVTLGEVAMTLPVGTTILVVSLLYPANVNLYALYLTTQVDQSQITLVSISDTPPAPAPGNERWSQRVNSVEEMF